MKLWYEADNKKDFIIGYGLGVLMGMVLALSIYNLFQ
jgi:gas vesicle protein